MMILNMFHPDQKSGGIIKLWDNYKSVNEHVTFPIMTAAKRGNLWSFANGFADCADLI